MSEDEIGELLDPAGPVQQLRVQRMMLALLVDDREIARLVREEVQADERGYEAAMWAMTYGAIEASLTIAKHCGIPADVLGDVLREQIALITLEQAE